MITRLNLSNGSAYVWAVVVGLDGVSTTCFGCSSDQPQLKLAESGPKYHVHLPPITVSGDGRQSYLKTALRRSLARRVQQQAVSTLFLLTWLPRTGTALCIRYLDAEHNGIRSER